MNLDALKLSVCTSYGQSPGSQRALSLSGCHYISSHNVSTLPVYLPEVWELAL